MDKKIRFSIKKCVWELMTVCNLKCIHCGSKAGTKNKNQFSLEKCLSVADELVDIECEAVCLIGGEVTLFHGWDLIADRLIDNGVFTNIITNGCNITNEIFETIQKSKISAGCISVKYITAVTTLTKKNIDDISELSIFLSENNVKIQQLQICSPFGNAKENKKITPDKNDIFRIMQIYRKLPQSPMRIQLADNIGYYIDDHEFIGCAGGLCVIGIDSDGNVRGCESLKDDRFIEGNLKTQTLKDIWNNENNFLYNRKFTPRLLTGKCADCEYGMVCAGGCRSHNFFSHNKLYESTVCARF